MLPDCFTALGGSQYVNSPLLGRHEDHIVRELVPLSISAIGRGRWRRIAG